MPPHSMGPPAPVQSSTAPSMAPPNPSMMVIDHEVSQQQQNLSGAVTSVVTTGPDGTAIDDASQQSTLSNASAGKLLYIMLTLFFKLLINYDIFKL